MKLMSRIGLLSLTMLLLGRGLLQAADGPELIPQTVTAVVALKAPSITLKEASAFVNDVQPGYGQLVLGQAGMLGVGISNPTMQGVDQKRNWYAAVFLKPDSEPEVAFVIPAIDVKAMEEAIDEDFEFLAHEDYGIYSQSADAIQQFRDHLATDRSKSVAAVASPHVKELVSNAHLAIGINLVSLKSTYRNELDQAKEELIEGFRQAQEDMPEVPGLKLDWLVGLLDGVVEKLQTAVQDSRTYVVTLTLAKSGVQLEEYLEFSASSPSSRFLAKYPPESMTLLAKLPANQLAYGSFSGSLAALNSWGMSIIPQMLELDEEQAAAWAEAEKMMKELTFGTSGGSFSLGDLNEGLVRAVSISEVSPTEKFRETAEKIASAMHGIEVPGVKQEITLEKNYEEIEGVKVDLMITRTTSDDGQFGGLQEQMNQILYGSDGAEARFAYLDGVYMQTVGGGSELMKTALQAYKQGTADSDPVLARDLKPLGEKNNVVGLIDLQSLNLAGLKIAVNSPLLPPMPFDEDSLDELKVERGYIGVSVGTTENGCGGKLHIPKQTLQAGLQMFGFFQELQQQQNAF